MGSPKSNSSKSTVVNRSVGRCVMEREVVSKVRERQTLVLLHNSFLPNIMYVTKIMSFTKITLVKFYSKHVGGCVMKRKEVNRIRERQTKSGNYSRENFTTVLSLTLWT